MVTEICFPFKVLTVWLELCWDFADWHSGNCFFILKCQSTEDRLITLPWPLTSRVITVIAEWDCRLFMWPQHFLYKLVQNVRRKIYFAFLWAT